MTEHDTAFLKFFEVCNAKSFEEFRIRFLIHANDCRRDHFDCAEGEFRPDFTAEAGRTEAYLARFDACEGNLLDIFDEMHIGCGVEFRGLDLFPKLCSCFHQYSYWMNLTTII